MEARRKHNAKHWKWKGFNVIYLQKVSPKTNDQYMIHPSCHWKISHCFQMLVMLLRWWSFCSHLQFIHEIGKLPQCVCMYMCVPSIHPLIHGLSAHWCPMSPHFLTRWVSRLLGWLWNPGLLPVLVSIAVSFAFHISVFSIHSSPAIGFHSCFSFMADVSAPIRSTLQLLTF